VEVTNDAPLEPPVSLDPPPLPPTPVTPPLPAARGPLSAFLIDHLRRPVHPLPQAPALTDHPLWGEDAPLALYCCYELHYRGLAGVDDNWEWEPSLLQLRRTLEEAYTEALAEAVGALPDVFDVPTHLLSLTADGDGPSLSGYMASDGTREQFREFAVHRSAYQLKEADPHSWALPRLDGEAKAALVEIQADEYGDGVESDMHATLFAQSMRALGLDTRYGGYLDLIPGITLSTVNLISMFGLHRRWRGALVGHLAVFEMTSVEPMGRYSAALRRLGYGPWARLFFDTHVVADAHHQAVAARDLAGGLVRREPQLARDIIFGAHAIMTVEGAFTSNLLGSWQAGRSSLLGPVPAAAAA